MKKIFITFLFGFFLLSSCNKITDTNETTNNKNEPITNNTDTPNISNTTDLSEENKPVSDSTIQTTPIEPTDLDDVYNDGKTWITF